MNQKLYYGKLLLFGEHTVVQGSEALAIPLQQFSGHWAWSKDDKNDSNLALQEYSKFLQTQSFEGYHINTAQFEEDLKNGLYFHSDIPQGFGAGSSGSICAAIFERYVTKITPENDEKKDDFFQKKLIFQKLEGFFHGSSSGVDPLICFFQKPLYIKNRNLSLVEVPRPSKITGKCFLIHTHLPRKTAPFVKKFQEALANSTFKQLCDDLLIPHNNAAIEAYLSEDKSQLLQAIELISDFQLKHVDFLIPEPFRAIWENGLNTKEYFLKVCGAGGGGFILGFTNQWESTQQSLKEYELIPVEDF